MKESTPLLSAEPRRIRLFGSSRFDASYLSWGPRQYGRIPVQAKPSEGWHYFLPLSGRATMLVNGTRVAAEPGILNIADPSCRIGHIDRADARCEVLTWIWRSPPSHTSLVPAKDCPLRVPLAGTQLRRLKRLHQQSRRMIADPSERNQLQLKISHLLVDLCLLDATQARGIPEPELRIDLAISYLRSHLADPFVVEGLRDYLQISKASLYRLFRQDTGIGPRAYSQELRMQWARKQLQDEGKPVKWVAYALGYRHPPDFSRAYAQYFGASASGRAKVAALPAEEAMAAI